MKQKRINTDDKKYGNLFVTYSIIFPKDLPKDRKELLVKILPNRTPISNENLNLVRKQLLICNEQDIVLFSQKNKPKNIFENILKNHL